MSTELDLGWLDRSLADLPRRDASGKGTGLCRAIAARIGIDVVLVRIAFVVLGLSAGLGVALYAWGTALTRGPHGTRPVDSLLPSFRSWSSGAQKAVVVISTIVFVATIGAATPLPWGTGVLALLVLLLWRRRPRATAEPAPLAEQTVAGSDEELVESWRRTMTAAVGERHASPLPTVDLYSPEPPVPARTEPAARSDWLAGLLLLAVTGAVGTVAVLTFGLSPLQAVAAVAITAGALTVLYAALARSRRIPRTMLALLLVPLATSGWLSTQAAAAPAQDPTVLRISVVGADRVVDLRDVDLTAYTSLEISAVASDLEVVLPGHIPHADISERLSDVTYTPGDIDTPAVLASMRVDALLSDVRVVEAP